MQHFYTCSAPTARFGLLYRNILFPSEDTAIKKVLYAQNYKRTLNQNIVEYFYEKLSRCNTARMQNREIIEWIVNGSGNYQYSSYLGPL